MKKYDHNSEPRQLSLFGDENVESQEEADEKVDATYDLTSLFQRLSQSAFRSRFHLTAKERAYIEEKGMATIRRHAEDFVSKRLASSLSPTMASRHQCAVILSFLPNMPQAAVAEVA